MSGRAVTEHPLLHRLCQSHLEGFVGPTGGILIHLDYMLPDADAFGKATNKAERFLLAPQAAKLQPALSSFSCCQALPGLGSAQQIASSVAAAQGGLSFDTLLAGDK